MKRTPPISRSDGLGVALSAAALLLLSALSLLAFGCGGSGKMPIVLYSPHGRDLLELFETTYEANHPEHDVRWLDMGSQEVYDRIRSEAANPQADVWFGGPDTIFSRGVEDDLLQPFRPTWADAVPPSSRHAEDRYFGLYLALPILVYNSDAVSEEEAPRDWEDLLDPRWTDEIVVRDPIASGTMRTAFGMILSRSIAETGDVEAGFDWLRRLDAQTKEYTQNPALLFSKLTRQEAKVSIWELTDILLLQQQGSPLAYRFATSGTPVIDDSIGLVANAPHADAAREFIEWVGSTEAQRLAAERLFRIPARTDLPRDELPSWAVEVLDSMHPAEVDWDRLAREGTAWMERWDREVRSQG